VDHDQAQQAMHAGTLVEAVVKPAADANGWVILLADRAGTHRAYTGHTGTEKVYHSLDQATAVARELGFESVRVDEDF
jgi:hypothetical protein